MRSQRNCPSPVRKGTAAQGAGVAPERFGRQTNVKMLREDCFRAKGGFQPAVVERRRAGVSLWDMK